MKKKYLSIIYLFAINCLVEKINSETFQTKRINRDVSEELNIDNNLTKKNDLHLQSKFSGFTYLLAEKINSQKTDNKSKVYGLDIISDSQFNSGDKYIAEGNVQIKKNNMLLQSDKLIYDLNKKIITIIGKIKFISDEQFFEASKIEYNLITKEGYIKNLYGTINFETLDLKNLNNTYSDSKGFSDIESSIKNLELNNSSSFKLENISSPQNLKVEIKDMTKWRMQSEEIKIRDNVWSAKVLYLTNDPFNEPQLVIKNKNFKSFEKDGKFIIKSGWSSIILEDKLKIPVGPKRYNLKKGNNFKWGIGYDKSSKDGLYITRYTDPLKIGKKSNLTFEKDIYIQRFIQGNTKSFSKKNESVFAEKTTQETKISDFFGISGELSSRLLGMDLNSEIKLNSLDLDKFKKIVTFKGELSREIFAYRDKDKDIQTKISLFGTYRDKVWNGSLGEKDILTAYGIKLENDKKWGNSKVSKLSKIAAGYGEYQSNEKSKNDDMIINRERLNLFWIREHNYNIWEANNDSQINKEYYYTPEPINKSIDFLISSKIDLYSYSDGNFQNLITFKAGPKITLGNLKNKYFDYSQINILGKTTIANGESPFDFDQSVDNHAIELEFKQQLIGPLIIKYSTEYNLDVNSAKFHEFSKNKYELNWNRRAFNIGIFYNEERQSGGINFEINSFKFDGYGDKF